MAVKFDQKLERFCENSEYAEWINRISKQEWAQSYDEGRRYGHMTTNLAECINGVLKGARKMPITALVQMTYFKLVEYFVNRKEKAFEKIANGQVWTDDLWKRWSANRERSTAHRVHHYDVENTRFMVEDAYNPETYQPEINYTVNLNERRCDCGLFQVYHFPCSHAIAACVSRRLDPFQYVDDVYRMESITKAYDMSFEPVRDMPWWPVIDGPTWIPNPKHLRVVKGRPQSTRIRNEMDWPESQRSSQLCRRCHQAGHNTRTCSSVGSSRTSGEGPSCQGP